MEGKTFYTLLVYSENIAGILNQITAVFTRRQVNIESLNVSASSIISKELSALALAARGSGS